TSLVEEFNERCKEVKKLPMGSDEYKVAIDGLLKTADRINEIEKREQEEDFKERSNTDELELKAEQLADERKDRKVRNVIEGVKVVGTLGLTAVAFFASMNFEKNGHMFSYEGSRAALRGLLKFGK